MPLYVQYLVMTMVILFVLLIRLILFVILPVTANHHSSLCGYYVDGIHVCEKKTVDDGDDDLFNLEKGLYVTVACIKMVTGREAWPLVLGINSLLLASGTD